MKKFTFLLFLAIGVIGCSVDSLDTNEEMLTADANMKVQNSVTITAPEGDLCVGETLSFTVTTNTNSNFQVQQLVGDDWIQVFLANKGLDGTESFEVVLAEGENFFRVKGARGFDDYPDSFVGVDCNSCENSLVAELTCGELNVLNLTFTAEEAGPVVIQGGLTAKTNIISSESNVLTENVTHKGVVKSKANVTRWEGNVEACEEVTITIEFTGGNGIGDWTAKRGEDELGETEEQKCDTEE